MKNSLGFLLYFSLFLNSCSYIVGVLDDGKVTVVNPSNRLLKEKNRFTLVFSHNVNGETHPCGCRHFPLGGLPQVAGHMHELRETSQVLYVDVGDTFFSSSRIPESMQKSLSFAAENLAKGFDLLKLDYFIPGDQDFAEGEDFLVKILKGKSFTPLIANLEHQEKWGAKKWTQQKIGIHRFFFTGIVNPDVLQPPYNSLFHSPIKSLEEVLKEMKASGLDPSSPFHRLIVFSHSGMDYDKNLAKMYPEITWIIGSHTQNFTRTPEVVGQTSIVQVLSRNHYLGQISFALESSKKEDKFELIEVRDELAKKLVPNPFMAFIEGHKEKVKALQLSEQETISQNPGNIRLSTASSCIECHSEQGTFWQQTPHALAYVTLAKVNEEANLNCISCHSLGAEDPRGFVRAKDIVLFPDLKDQKLDHLKEQYWKEFKNITKNIKEVRSLSKKELAVHKKMWIELDANYKVRENYANVQCLNCHTKHVDHPFEVNPVKIVKEQRFKQIQQKCIGCHTRDQSPEWYVKNKQGLAGHLNEAAFTKLYQRLSCPKRKE